MGFGNWADESQIIVYFRAEPGEQVKGSFVKHLTNLVRAIFMNVRPSPPAQSRWTGVCAVARFCFGLYSFHNLLKGIFAYLKPIPSNNKGKGRGRGKGKGGKGGRNGRGKGKGQEEEDGHEDQDGQDVDPVPQPAGDLDVGP